MQKVLENKKYLLLFVLLAVVTVTTVAKLSKSKLFTSLRKDKYDYIEVQEGDEAIDGSTDVTFDAYFLKDIDNDGEADGLRGSNIEYGKQDKLYFDLNVSGDKKIKNASLTFVSNNVKVGGTLAKSSVIPSNMSNTNFQRINFSNEIGTGTSSFFYLSVTPFIENDLNNFSSDNKIIFEGTVVDNITSEETPIRKEITYHVDTYSKNIGTSIYSTASSNPINSANITYTIEVQENYDAMPMKASYLSGSVADFEGRHPSSVTLKSADNSEIEFNYDSETQTFTAVKKATVNDENIITKQAYNTKNGSTRFNKWIINVSYPVESNESLDNKTTTINVKAWNVGYSDGDLTEKKSNEVNRVISHILTVRPEGTQLAFSDKSKIYIGTYAESIGTYFVDKTFLENVYLGQENGNFTYKEEWDLDSTTDRQTPLLYREIGDKFISSQSMHDFTTYKKLKVINTPNVSNYKLKIINADNGEMLHIIDSTNVSEEYEFPQDVRKISIETNEINKGANFKTKIQFTKEIDTVQLSNNIPITTFALYGSITNSGTVAQSGVSLDATNPFNGTANFSETYSNARITSGTTNYSRTIEETTIPMTYVIKHNNVDAASKLWAEGYYLIKLPKEIIDVENLKVTNSNYVISDEVIEIDGNKFIKIINDFSGRSNNIDITVKFDAIINPKESDCSGKVELYAINNTTTLYNSSGNDIYDLNGNGSTTDKSAYSSLYITITAPNELLTGSIIKDYDNEGSETVSPLIADIDPTKGDSDANVDVFLVNNSSFKIKNIELVGKLAYRGNKYEGLTDNIDLGSEFDVYLSGPIQVPSELEDKVTIYYTTVENPTRDINDTNNGWTTSVSDYNTIKTYMIKFDDNIEMNKGKTYDFIFPIDVPSSTTNLLKKTYFNHGVYFNRVTDAGTLSGKVTAPKLGVRMSRIYDIDLNVFKAFSDNKVPGGTYILTDEDGNKQTLSLDSNGHTTLNGLYVNKEYKLKHYSAPRGYIVDSEEKTFKIVNQNDDSLSLVKDGTYRSIDYTNNNVLKIDLDSEILYTLDLHNIDVDSSADIKDTVFKVTGKNHEHGSNITTGYSGHAYLNNLVLGEVYNVEQIKIFDYSTIDSFKFKIDRDPNTHEVKILVESYPEIVKSNDCDAIFLDLDSFPSGYSIKSNPKYGYLYGRTYKCNYTIDLTNFTGEYKLQGHGNLTEYMYGDSYNPYVKLSLVKDLKNTAATPFYTLQKTSVNYNSYSVSSYFNTTKAYEKVGNAYNEVNIKGGNIYNLYLEYKSTGVTWSGGNYTNGNVTLSSVKLDDVTGKPGFVFVEEKENVHPKLYYSFSGMELQNNNNVSQTLNNYSVNDSNNPVLEIEVKNKYITKSVLEISKVDAETGDSLTGAQYKIIGPGLPAKGKYVTIDEDGKGSVDIYLSYTGSTDHIPGMNDNYPKVNTYTVQEVIPPKGYSLNSDVVKFKFVANADYNSSTDELTYTYDLKYDIGSKFKEFEIDTDNKILKVKVEDYPIVKVSKTDEETGEILPNTYYAVYKISRENGNEYTEFAKDSDGNYIGEKITVDNQQYYVVKTDENGSFTLNLPSGQYQLKEIQAADDKYEISDQIIYFGVGETVPYQDAGLTLKRGIGIPTNYPPNESNAKVYPTDDGGYITIMLGSGTSWNGSTYIVKYDADMNVSWFKTYVANYKYNYLYKYFDNPDRATIVPGSTYTDSNQSYYAFKEYDDAYYLGLEYNDIIKIDKDTGNILYESGIEKPGFYEYTYQQYCDKNNYNPPNYQLNPEYPDKYYCNTSDYVLYNYWAYYDYEPHMYFGDDGYAYVISKIANNGNYGFMLKDGTKIIPTKGDLKSTTSYYFLKMDLEGNVIEATELSNKLHDAQVNFIDEYLPELEDKINNKIKANNSTAELTSLETTLDDFNISYNKNEFRVLPNGDICFVVEATIYKYNYKYTYVNSSTGQEYNNTSNDSQKAYFVIRMDKDFNVKYYVPIGYRGQTLYVGSDSNYVDNNIRFNDDGSFEYARQTNITMGRNLVEDDNNTPHYEVNNYIFNNVYNNFDPKIEEGYYHPPHREGNSIYTYSNHGYLSYVIFKWDSNGMAEDTIELSRVSKNINLYDSSNDFKRMWNYNNYMSIIKVDDGYIVGAPQAYQGNLNTYSEEYRTVELASGEIVVVDPKTTYTLYKVNNDSSVEWVKQYGNIYTNRYSFNMNTILKDNKFALYKLSTNTSFAEAVLDGKDGELITSVNDPNHAKITDNSSFVLLEFELLDEVTPSAPEATTLNLTNRRKEYKINITNNEGGTFEITTPQGEVEYNGSEPGLVETVKHGDDTEKTIKVTPNRGYDIKKITVNGEPAKYSVSEDGTVTIDKFTGVTEEKNINVTFERGMSRVVVHHYLKDTTIPISSDELLTGRIDTDYETDAKVSALYNLAKDDDGEYIIPNNAKGKYALDPIEVTYYYEVNMVKLKVNFYKVDTEISLADSIENTYVLGSRYLTEALGIEHYTVVGVVGNESGTLTSDLTEVTYFYDNAETAKIEVNYLDVDTGLPVANKVTKVIPINTRYETEKLVTDPEGYDYLRSEGDVVGTITEPNSTVVVNYFYTRIKSTITTRYLDPVTKKDITEKKIQVVNLGDEYETHELDNIPKGYKLIEIPSNYKGVATKRNIEVVYYYEKIKDVKDDVEVPDTSDDSLKYFIISFTSLVSLILVYKIKSKLS